TGNDLDLAIRGEGFFVVNSGKGDGNEKLRFTRDGRFTLNASNQIVMATTGMQVLDENDLAIEVRPGAVLRIDPSGLVFEDEKPLARIQVAAIPNRTSLRKAGDGMFASNSNAQNSRLPATANLEQGFVESSAVDPILALSHMVNLTKTVQANARMLQFHDSLMDQVINRVGRIA
ncbi:MAG: flagellar basal body rod C-terminal domain-containing protein, partial [Phycisphaerales bacterium]